MINITINNSSTSMIPGWPDAVRCGSVDYPAQTYLLHAVNYTSSTYVQVFAAEYRSVSFRYNGDYLTSTGDDVSSSGCDSKSIQQLYREGRVFHFLTSKMLDPTNTTTMIPGWPDAIRCGSGTMGGSIAWLHGADNTGAFYTPQMVSTVFQPVVFSSNGSFLGTNDISTMGCQGKSMQQLYQEGRAFNLVTSKIFDPIGTSTMYANSPDAIRCGVGNVLSTAPSGKIAPWGAIYLFGGIAPATTITHHARYDQAYPLQERCVLFSSMGQYYLRRGDDQSSIGCVGKSIQQLSQEGRIFNFVTSRVPDTTISYTEESQGIIANLTARSSTGMNPYIPVFFVNIVGSNGPDQLVGDANVNHLQGMDGDDVIDGRAGADTLDGGNGNDTVSYATSSGGVTINLETHTCEGGDARGDQLSHFENILGSRQADTLIGDAQDNIIEGGASADILDGRAGHDTVSYRSSTQAVTINLETSTCSGGDAQGDTIAHFENIIGSNQGDTLTGNNDMNQIQGLDGDDLIEGRGGPDLLDGGAGQDTVSYDSSLEGVQVDFTANLCTGGDAEGDVLTHFENIVGSQYADQLTGDEKANAIYGGDDDDVIEGRAGGDTLDGGEGIDTLVYRNSPAGVTVNLVSGASRGGDAEGDTFVHFENIQGSAYTDQLTGNGQSNTIEGGAGADSLDGGLGIDTLSYASSAAGVAVSLSTGQCSGGDAQGDIIANFDNLLGSMQSDHLTGDARVNLLQGNGGDDVLEGLGGADSLQGGDGSDTASYEHALSAVQADLSTGQGQGGDADGDRFIQIENLSGSAYHDQLVGDANVNTLQGNGGDDVLAGLGGADILDGGAGSDTAVYTHSTYAVTVDLGTGRGQGGDAEGDRLSNIEHVIGSNQSDTLIGDDNLNTLQGLDGNDVIEGRGGADNLEGGLGQDTVSYQHSPSGVTVNLATGIGAGGDARGDVITGFENILGSAYNDTLTGDEGPNRLEGGGGNDTLVGAGGADTFRLTRSAGVVTVADFEVGSAHDQIDLTLWTDLLNFSALQQHIQQDGKNTKITFTGGQLILNNVNANTLNANHFLFAGDLPHPTTPIPPATGVPNSSKSQTDSETKTTTSSVSQTQTDSEIVRPLSPSAVAPSPPPGNPSPSLINTSPSPEQSGKKEAETGLSSGQLAGIIVGSAVGSALIAGMSVGLWFKYRGSFGAHQCGDGHSVEMGTAVQGVPLVTLPAFSGESSAPPMISDWIPVQPSDQHQGGHPLLISLLQHTYSKEVEANTLAAMYQVLLDSPDHFIPSLLATSSRHNVSILLDKNVPSGYAVQQNLVSIKMDEQVYPSTQALLVHELTHSVWDHIVADRAISQETLSSVYENTLKRMLHNTMEQFGVSPSDQGDLHTWISQLKNDTSLELFYLSSNARHTVAHEEDEALLLRLEKQMKLPFSSSSTAPYSLADRSEALLRDEWPTVVKAHHLDAQAVYLLERMADYIHGLDQGIYPEGSAGCEEIAARCVELRVSGVDDTMCQPVYEMLNYFDN